MKPLLPVLLLTVLGSPLLLPVAELFRTPAAWSAWLEAGRLAELARTTVLLAGATLLLVLPPGLVLAALLYRSDLPGRSVLGSVLTVGLFVPLPLFAVAWLSVARPGGGIGTAAMVHAAAALPWVVWLTGQGLARVERAVEEDARLAASGPVVLLRVALPLAAPAVAAAALTAAVQATTEIAVTDLFGVRTFAEDVYTQFVGAGDGLARSVAVSLPPAALTAVLAAWAVCRWEARRPPGEAPEPALLIRLGGRGRWLAFALVAGAVVAYAAVPVGGLVRQLGSAHYLAVAARAHGATVLDSLLWSAFAGAIAAGLALAACRRAADSPRFRGLLLALAVGAWALPGPVVGVGLKLTIDRLLDLEEIVLGGAGLLRGALYDGPSPLPVLWAAVVRTFPYAVAVLWPAVRSVPRELRDAARLDGAELRLAVWPQTRAAFVTAATVAGLLALGELSAGKLVQVPGRQTFVQDLFNQMHYGTGPTLAALGLVQLALTVAIAAPLLGFVRAANGRNGHCLP